MATSVFDIPKIVDMRDKLTKHAWRRYSNVGIHTKNTIIIHHSLTKEGSAESYANYHVTTHGWPGIGYQYVIEKDGTIKVGNDIDAKSYHVGNHNRYAIGICLTGDFRTQDPTEEQKESLYNLVDAIQTEYKHVDKIKGHNELSGYSWKKCPEFDFRAVLAAEEIEANGKVEASEVPETYKIQEGDTLWSIARGMEGVSVDEIIDLNEGIDAIALTIGKSIRLRPKSEIVSGLTKFVPKRLVQTTTDLWKHDAPNFKKSSQTSIMDEGFEFFAYGETDNMYAVGGGEYASKKYIEVLPQNDLPDTVLRRGDKGKYVETVQGALNSIYFKAGETDGSYGPTTEDAVRRFQMVHTPFGVDGVYGPKTRAAMLDELGW